MAARARPASWRSTSSRTRRRGWSPCRASGSGRRCRSRRRPPRSRTSLPAAGIVGMAGSYGLLRTWGFGSSEVARAVTLTGIWNQLANLLLPVIAVMLLSHRAAADAVLTTVAVVGRHRLRGRGRAARARLLERRARAGGRRARRAFVNRLLRAFRRRPTEGWPDRLVEFRRSTVDLIRRRWAWLTIAAIVGNVTVFVVLLVSLRAVGHRLERAHLDRGVRRLVARAGAPADPADAGRCRTRRARAHGDPRRLRRRERRGRRGGAPLPRLHRASRRCSSGSRRSPAGAGSGRTREGVDAAAGNPPGG